MTSPHPTAVSPAGLLFIAGWEGLRVAPYNDAAGNATIGYGHLLHMGNVTAGDVERWAGFARVDALNLLRGDVRHAAACVAASVKPPLSMQTRFDALTSFVFNLGCGALASSQLLRYLNAGVRDHRAWDQLLRWDHAGGRQLAGLTRRRLAERALALHGTYGSA